MRAPQRAAMVHGPGGSGGGSGTGSAGSPEPPPQAEKRVATGQHGEGRRSASLYVVHCEVNLTSLTGRASGSPSRGGITRAAGSLHEEVSHVQAVEALRDRRRLVGVRLDHAGSGAQRHAAVAAWGGQGGDQGAAAHTGAVGAGAEGGSLLRGSDRGAAAAHTGAGAEAVEAGRVGCRRSPSRDDNGRHRPVLPGRSRRLWSLRTGVGVLSAPERPSARGAAFLDSA